MSIFARTPGPGQITVTEAHDRARTGEAALLDVRESAEYTAGHAPGAIWQSLAAIAAGAPVPDEVRGRPVLAVCRSGNRSGRAAKILGDRGVEVLNVAGGMNAWAAAGLPVQDGAGNDGQVI